MLLYPDIYERYADDWDLDPRSSLWDGCRTFIGGKGGGRLAIDSSRHNNHCALNASTTSWADGPNRRALYFTGVNSGFDQCSKDPLAGAARCTFGCWLKSPSAWSNYDSAFTTIDSGNTGGICVNHYSVTGNRLCGQLEHIYRNYVETDIDVSVPFDWTHVAFVYDGSAFSSYVNGEFYTSRSRSGVVLSDGNPLCLGSLYVNHQNWRPEQYLADVFIYDRVLAAAEVRQLASLRPDLGGALRSSSPLYVPAGVASSVYTPIHHLLAGGI